MTDDPRVTRAVQMATDLADQYRGKYPGADPFSLGANDWPLAEAVLSLAADARRATEAEQRAEDLQRRLDYSDQAAHGEAEMRAHAEAELDEWKRRADQLATALRPFAEAAKDIDPLLHREDDAFTVVARFGPTARSVSLRFGDLYRAASALAGDAQPAATEPPNQCPSCGGAGWAVVMAEGITYGMGVCRCKGGNAWTKPAGGERE